MNAAPSGMNDGEQMAERKQVISGVKLENEGLLHTRHSCVPRHFFSLYSVPFLEAPWIEQRQQFFVTGPRQRRKL
jgi:hypothetical protein